MKYIGILLGVLILLCIITSGCLEEGEHEKDKDKEVIEENIILNQILKGKGLNKIQIGDNLTELKEAYGEPEEMIHSNSSIYVSYMESKALNFLLKNETNKIIEIRFNLGFSGETEDKIQIGSQLDDVLSASGGANKTVEANVTETHSVLLGTDKVLYKQMMWGKINAYKFIDAKAGILYWFNEYKYVTQIVVFEPY